MTLFTPDIHTTNMVTQDLLDYISGELQHGLRKQEIANTLIAEGWKSDDIESAFSQVRDSAKLHLNKPITMLLLGFILVSGLLIGSFVGTRLLDTKKADKVDSQLSPVSPGLTLTPARRSAPAVSSSSAYSAGADNILDCGTETFTVDISGSSKNTQPKLECFIEAAKVCAPAKLTLNPSVDVSGIQTTNTVNYDIAKLIDGCKLHIYQGEIVFKLPVGISEEILDPVTSVVKQLENTEGNCIFKDNNDLVKIFEQLNNGDTSIYVNSALQGQTSNSDMYVNGNCSGSYFAALNNTNPAQ